MCPSLHGAPYSPHKLAKFPDESSGGRFATIIAPYWCINIATLYYYDAQRRLILQVLDLYALESGTLAALPQNPRGPSRADKPITLREDAHDSR